MRDFAALVDELNTVHVRSGLRCTVCGPGWPCAARRASAVMARLGPVLSNAASVADSTSGGMLAFRFEQLRTEVRSFDQSPEGTG